MGKLQYLLGVALLVCGAACSAECLECDCEDCEDAGSGHLELIRDWSGLWQGINKPAEIDIYMYHPTLAPWHKCTYTDTSYHVVPAGSYRVIAISRSETVKFQGMENYYTAEVCLPTQTIDSVLMVDEAPLHLIDYTAVNVFAERTTKCLVAPSPFIKVVNFRIHINRSGNVKEIVECKGRLNGVLTSAKICVVQNRWSSACLDFSTVKDVDNFTKTVTLLGMNPGTGHELQLTLLDTDGTSKEFKVDITGKLDFADAPVLNCTIEINLTGTQAEIGIMDWLPGISDDVMIQ